MFSPSAIRIAFVARLFAITAVLLSVFMAQADAGDSNSLMDISADGKLLACANRECSTLTIVDLATRTKLAEINVGKHPEGVTFLGETHRIAIAVYAEDKIVFVDGDSLTNSEATLSSVDVFDEPYGVVSNSDGTRIYVTLDFPGRVVEIDTQSMKITSEIAVGNFVRGIAITPDDESLFVTEFYTSVVKQIDLASGKVVDEWTGTSTDNLSRQITLNPKRNKAYLPHIRSRVTAVHGEGSIFPYMSIVDTIQREASKKSNGKRRTRIPVDSVFSTRITANPWEIAVSSDGRQLYIVFAGTNDLFACEIIDDDYREIDLRKHVRLGSNPRAVQVSPDRKTVYVYNALDFEVVAYDTDSLESLATVQISKPPYTEDILVGNKLFNTALQPMAGRRWISCSSCHPDGQPDSRTWHNPEGLRNTQSLGGMAWTHPVHWSADRDEVQDFEHTIRGPLMQGRGLSKSKIDTALGKPSRGLSSDLDALASYSNSHEISLSPFAKNGLSDAAKRGQTLFHSEQANCASCHSNAFYSDSQPRLRDEIVRHNVGTGDDDPSETMGSAYDTPTLLGIYRTAPYLHHGKAKTLEEVFTKFNPDDQHGMTSHLSEEQVADLVEYLKALPFEDPIAQAKNQNLKNANR